MYYQCYIYTIDLQVSTIYSGFRMFLLYIYTPPSDKKSQTWSETLGISYPRRHGPGVQWKGLGSIWKKRNPFVMDRGSIGMDWGPM